MGRAPAGLNMPCGRPLKCRDKGPRTTIVSLPRCLYLWRAADGGDGPLSLAFVPMDIPTSAPTVVNAPAARTSDRSTATTTTHPLTENIAKADAKRCAECDV